jgi:hypothetical protein
MDLWRKAERDREFDIRFSSGFTFFKLFPSGMLEEGGWGHSSLKSCNVPASDFYLSMSAQM